MFPAQEEADRTVFVGNLEARVREEILYELFLQPWHTHSPMMQPPFYDMTASLPSNTSGSCPLSYTPDLKAGPCSYEWTHQQPSEPDLYHRGQRKRQRQASDSGSSSEDQGGNEGGQKCRKCKRKKKY
ncbi:Splicing regulator RBM11 [Microtus ochrogaster]|uniref:Splicing regulator RBM11 n=1 Tax=Microtus ochrogaster TaxID=79684 RepID=A0A8J6GJE0_MICOH|nr:Splicing regulator RBM11 [Microtus ochrogaster]